jgi:hypothetical protein
MAGPDDEQVEAPTFLRGAVRIREGGLVFEGGSSLPLPGG